jgi:hypothetical protein
MEVLGEQGGYCCPDMQLKILNGKNEEKSLDQSMELT